MGYPEQKAGEQLSQARGREQGVSPDGDRVSSWGHENVLELDRGALPNTECANHHWVVHFKWLDTGPAERLDAQAWRELQHGRNAHEERAESCGVSLTLAEENLKRETTSGCGQKPSRIIKDKSSSGSKVPYRIPLFVVGTDPVVLWSYFGQFHYFEGGSCRAAQADLYPAVCLPGCSSPWDYRVLLRMAARITFPRSRNDLGHILGREERTSHCVQRSRKSSTQRGLSLSSTVSPQNTPPGPAPTHHGMVLSRLQQRQGKLQGKQSHDLSDWHPNASWGHRSEPGPPPDESAFSSLDPGASCPSSHRGSCRLALVLTLLVIS
ncbi:uncharacterized protein LOC124968510 [Sciurus carolinensis]|uniref:uncharacterized protein LOC124968510 n=1 Tax=Sciurus carolinensis TaxID=30640 RepID=UPI001FB39C58|nr:uncharacterized protein LOC124968510 [Sciurus carolinensis]XP_047386990.1 uncharacterized protein LOC124968510 [Sciurus carolinensis]